jgi:selenide,water dikinase
MSLRLVLAGLGHAHLFVLEALAHGRLAGCEVLVCTGEQEHVYSGMVPGWLGGRYDRSELTLDTDALCRWAGATRVPHHVRGVDPIARTVTIDTGERITFDLCSIAVGSQPAGLNVPGAREHALPLKPLHNVQRLRERLAALARAGSGAVTIVGAGLAGLEMAFAARARLEQDGASGDAIAVRVIGREDALVPERGARLARHLERACRRGRVALLLGVTVREVRADALLLSDGRTLPSDLTVWATGAAAPTWLAESGLPVDDRGFLLVDEHLRTLGAAHVLAAGDCATPASWRGTPKAGVYAVRQGPVLADTLSAVVSGRALPSPYAPQRQFLALVNTGDGRAIASRGAFAVEGRWAMHWKDRLDRAFIARFRARR